MRVQGEAGRRDLPRLERGTPRVQYVARPHRAAGVRAQGAGRGGGACSPSAQPALLTLTLPVNLVDCASRYRVSRRFRARTICVAGMHSIETGRDTTRGRGTHIGDGSGRAPAQTSR